MTDSDEAPQDDPASTSGDDELLAQLEARLREGQDPLGALASVLTSRAERRRALFSWTGEVVMGYRLERILGAGGTGVTYAGVHPERGDAAVKLVVLSGGSSEARFARECSLLESFSHDAIVSYRSHQIIDVGVGALVMDRIEGVDFEQVLLEVEGDRPVHPAAHALMEGIDGGIKVARRSPTFCNRLLELAAFCADGLAAVHREGVVHRDVKPANTLVDGALQPTLIDFGFAREWEPGGALTMSGVAIGTFGYMAPEQLAPAGAEISGATDTYGLGLVLFRALLGRLPVGRLEDLTQTRRRGVRMTASERAALPPSVFAVLERSLQRDPERRYAAAELAIDLRAAAAGVAVPRIETPLAARVFPLTALLAAVVAVALFLWPSAGEPVTVVFRANCRSADAFVQLEDGDRVFLDEPIELAPGRYTAQLVGEQLSAVGRSFSVPDSPRSRPLQVVLLTQYRPGVARDKLLDEGTTLAQFMSGHSLVPVQVGAPRDRRWVDDVRVEDWGPFPTEAALSRGRHVFRAVDGEGRQERIEVSLGAMPSDILLLPSVLSDVDGAFRCTWTSILSPRPAGLSFDYSGPRWLGPAQASPVGGGGLMALPCALTNGAPNESSHLHLEVAFPEPMSSAVIYLGTRVDEGGAMELEAALGEGGWQPWPKAEGGGYAARISLASPDGATRLRVRAAVSAARAPSRGRTDVALLDGVMFGGHWEDHPPCFAVVADPSDCARIAAREPARPLGPELALADSVVIELPQALGNTPGALGPLLSPSGEPRLWMTSGGPGPLSHGAVSEWRWPELELLQWRALSETMPTGPTAPPRPFAGQLIALPPRGAADGAFALGSPGWARGGRFYAGTVARLDQRSLQPTWRAPAEAPSEPFGDEGYGNALVYAPDLFDGALLTAASSFRERGVKVGLLSILDADNGEELWRQTGTPEQPYDNVVGWCPGDGSGWVVARTIRREGPAAPVLSTSLRAVSVDAPDHQVPITTVIGPQVTALLLGAGASTPALFVASTHVEPAELILARYEPSAPAWSLATSSRLRMPLELDGPPAEVWLPPRATPDLDGDGLPDVVCATLPVGGIDGTGRTREDSHLVFVLSSGTLQPLGWLRTAPGEHLFDAQVFARPDGSHDLLLFCGPAEPGGPSLRLRRFALR